MLHVSNEGQRDVTKSLRTLSLELCFLIFGLQILEQTLTRAFLTFCVGSIVRVILSSNEEVAKMRFTVETQNERSFILVDPFEAINLMPSSQLFSGAKSTISERAHFCSCATFEIE